MALLCDYCGHPFSPRRRHQVNCSKRCRDLKALMNQRRRVRDALVKYFGEPERPAINTLITEHLGSLEPPRRDQK